MRMSPITKRMGAASLALLLVLATLFGCVTTRPTGPSVAMHQLTLLGDDEITMEVGDRLQLQTDAPEGAVDALVWTSSSPCVGITQEGEIVAQAVGEATVTVAYFSLSDHITVAVVLELPEDTQGGHTTPGGTTSAETTPEGTVPGESIPEDTVPGESTPEDTVPGEVPPDTVAPAPDTGGPNEPETEYIPPTAVIEAERSPAGYRPAGSRQEALDRAQNGELAGYPYVPEQAPNISAYRPMEDGTYIKNNHSWYIDENTYVVVDAYGREVFRVYRGGAYITLEEVAAYVWAFGDIPANHSVSKSTRPSESIWGEYLRVNHTKFSGNTSRYPYEPELPRISGCGGDLTYYELDIGTTGTDCDPAYTAALYNNGSWITRGAARIVYARFDRNGNKIIEADEKYVFYTYNHYNDFQEYLNYYGGWGEMFGNITGGGSISSNYDYNPTPYVPVVTAPLTASSANSRAASVTASLPASLSAPVTARRARILPVLYTDPILLKERGERSYAA